MSGNGRHSGAGGFESWLHDRSDAELADLLAARPDLVTPVPTGVDALASRAGRRLSLERALDDLDQFSLHVIETLLALPCPVPAAALEEVLGAPPEPLARCLAALCTRALAWHSDGGFRPAPGLRAVISEPRIPTAPGSVSAAPPPLDGAQTPEPARDSQPAANGPEPSVAGPGDVAPHSPAEQYALSGRADGAPGVSADMPVSGRRPAWPQPDRGPGEHAEGENAAGRRLDATSRATLGGAGLSARPLAGLHEVDEAAAAAALNALRCVEDLLNRWAAVPPPVLRSGGLGIRELRKAAAAADIDLAAAALLTEVSRAAGLLAASSWTDGEWLPTHTFDAWLDTGQAGRWAALVSAWLATTRVPGFVGSRDETGRLLNALGTGLDRMDAPRVRARVLGELVTVPPGTFVSTAAMLRRLAWLWPRRPQASQAMLAQGAMREAAMLGLTGLGGLATHGRAALVDGPAEAAAALARILPEPVGHVLLQADLTAVAPGPLTADLARELSLMADVESTGGATVYRFSAGSVRRAMDAGRTGDELLAMLSERSRTPVPQPLRYLIEDIARRHGKIRVGTAAAYIRCEDPTVAAEIAADRRMAKLRLRLLAPTVLVCRARRSDVLAVLRRLGYAPAAESADGTVEITAATTRRAEDRAGRYGVPAMPGPLDPGEPWPVEERALAAVRVLRAGG